MYKSPSKTWCVCVAVSSIYSVPQPKCSCCRKMQNDCRLGTVGYILNIKSAWARLCKTLPPTGDVILTKLWPTMVRMTGAVTSPISFLLSTFNILCVSWDHNQVTIERWGGAQKKKCFFFCLRDWGRGQPRDCSPSPVHSIVLLLSIPVLGRVNIGCLTLSGASMRRDHQLIRAKVGQPMLTTK